MRSQRNKKAFRALGPDVVEKMFLQDDEPVPPEWFDNIADALANYGAPVVEATEKQPAKRGRPRKDQ